MLSGGAPGFNGPKSIFLIILTEFSPGLLAGLTMRNYVREQDLQAARTRTPLARVLGLGHLDCLLART